MPVLGVLTRWESGSKCFQTPFTTRKKVSTTFAFLGVAPKHVRDRKWNNPVKNWFEPGRCVFIHCSMEMLRRRKEADASLVTVPRRGSKQDVIGSSSLRSSLILANLSVVQRLPNGCKHPAVALGYLSTSDHAFILSE